MSRESDDLFFSNMSSTKPENLEKKAELAPPSPEAKAEPVSRPITPRNLFSNPEAHPVVLDLALLKNLELDWFSWLPETLFKEIELTFKTSIAEVNKMRILAAQTLHVTDSFWDQWEIFEKTIHALSGSVPRVGIVQPPDLPMLLSAVSTANNIRKEEFSEEVGRYCAAVFLHENVHYAPPPMEFVQQFLSQPMYRCKDCDNTRSALPPWDGYCDSCIGRFTTDKAFSLRPDPEAVARGAGKNVEVFLAYDPSPVKQRFETLESAPESEFNPDVSEDIQAAKLVTAVDYCAIKERQCAEQLKSLRDWLVMS